MCDCMQITEKEVTEKLTQIESIINQYKIENPYEDKRDWRTYYMRQEVEILFGFSKDDLALYPLRVHSEDRIRGFLFLQFITLIVFIQLKKKIGNKYTVEEALLTMRNLKCKVFDNELIISELTKDQKDLCEEVSVVVPKTAGI